MASSSSSFAIHASATRNTGNVAWSNPSNAQSSNDVYATSSFSSALGGGYTQYLSCTSPSLSVPGGSTIDGIEFQVERKYTDGGEGLACLDQEVYVIKGSVRQTTQNKASGTSWPTTDATQTYGGATDTWGLTWTSSDFGSGFGFALCARSSPQPSEAGGTAYIDRVLATVYYTTSSGTPGISRMLMGVG